MKTDKGKADAYVRSARMYIRDRKYAEAGGCFTKALKFCPDDVGILIEHARFLTEKKEDYDKARNIYTNLFEKLPNDPDWLNDFRDFLIDHDKNYELADKVFSRKEERDRSEGNPASIVRTLGEHAIFLAYKKGDYEKAERKFDQAIKYSGEEKLPWLIDAYARFLYEVKNDVEKSLFIYEKEVDEGFDDLLLMRYARLLFITGKPDLAVHFLEKAEQTEEEFGFGKCERAFYRYAHCPPYDLIPVKQELECGGYPSPDWKLLSANVKRATEDHHPHPELLAAIAQVISGEQSIETLNTHPEWTQNS